MDTKFVVEVNHDDLEFEIDRIAEFEYEFDNLHIIDVSEDLKQELVVVPTTEQQVIVPEGDQVYDKVTVEPIQPPFVDVSDTTATPEDVSSGKVFYDATGTRQEGVVGAGDDLFLCRVIDWEGTILKEEWLPAGAIFTMPEDATYEGLVFDGWSGPVDLVDNAVVVEDMDLIFGAMYHTASGLTEVDVELNEATGLIVTLNIVGNKDWGDGTTDTETTHTYTDYGNYTIKYDGYEGTTTSSGMFGQSSSNKNYYVKSVRFGNEYVRKGCLYCAELETMLLSKGLTSTTHSLASYCPKLKCLVIPNTITWLDAGLSNSGLKHIVIPNTITTLREIFRSTNVEYISINIPIDISSSYQYFFADNYMLKRAFVKMNGIKGHYDFSNCYKLEKAKIEIKTGTEFGNAFLYNCKSLRELEIISDTLTTIGDFCNSCTLLEKAILPDSITTFTAEMFSYCYNLREVHLPENLINGGNGLFRGAYSLERVDLPKNIGEIGAFLRDAYPFDFSKLEFPASLTTLNNIGYQAYSNAVVLPPNLISVGSIYPYSRVYGVVELPDSITTMGAIQYWSNATAVIMPASLTTISSSSFGQECPNIKLYDFSKCSVVPTLAYSASTTFANKSPLMRIVVPDALYDEWIVATNWVKFVDYIVKASEYTGG